MPRKKAKARKLYHKRLSKKRLSKILGVDYDKLTIKGNYATNDGRTTEEIKEVF